MKLEINYLIKIRIGSGSWFRPGICLTGFEEANTLRNHEKSKKCTIRYKLQQIRSKQRTSKNILICILVFFTWSWSVMAFPVMFFFTHSLSATLATNSERKRLSNMRALKPVAAWGWIPENEQSRDDDFKAKIWWGKIHAWPNQTAY